MIAQFMNTMLQIQKKQADLAFNTAFAVANDTPLTFKNQVAHHEEINKLVKFAEGAKNTYVMYANR